jgi:predicted nucleic acid-binding protein
MIAVDSSVAIAAFSSWSENHERATDLLNTSDAVVLPAHAALETYSVCTRLPPPYRVDPEMVGLFLESWFGSDLPQLPRSGHRAFRARLVDLHITGGAVYDALIASTALHFGASLATFDARAYRTYDLIGVEVHPLTP